MRWTPVFFLWLLSTSTFPRHLASIPSPPRIHTVHKHIEDLTAKSFFIDKYFIVLAGNHDFVLHYVPLANEDYRKRYPMPTVPPVNFTFQNMLFVQNDKDSGVASEDNKLVYLQMCGDPSRGMPRELLPVSVVTFSPLALRSTSNYLSRQIRLSPPQITLTAMMERLLFPLTPFLTVGSSSGFPISTGAHPGLSRDAWWKATKLGLGMRFYLAGKLGLPDAPYSDVKWNPIDAIHAEPTVGNKVNGQIGQWYKYYYVSDKDDPNGAWPWRVWQKGSTTNWLFIPEAYNANGKCEIFVHGNTVIEFYVHVDLPSSTGWVNGEWSMKIVLDGELIIRGDDIGPKITRYIDEALLHRGNITAFTEPAEEGLKELSMTYIINEMRNVFKSGWDFVLPGGADFYISRAVFNREKDLVCELKYKFNA